MRLFIKGRATCFQGFSLNPLLSFYPQISFYIFCKSRGHLHCWKDPSRIFQMCLHNSWCAGISLRRFHVDVRFEQKTQGRTKPNVSVLSPYEESTFLLSGNSCLFNQCSLEIPINESFSPFLLMPCCVPQSPQGSCLSFCPHLPWSLVIVTVWVKGKWKINSGKSRSPFLPRMENILGSLPASKPEDWLCGSLDFPLWVLSMERCVLFLFDVFHFKDPITFSWILQWACWPNNSFIPNFHHYLCLKFPHMHTSARECVWRTQFLLLQERLVSSRAESQVHSDCSFLIFWGHLSGRLF